MVRNQMIYIMRDDMKTKPDERSLQLVQLYEDTYHLPMDVTFTPPTEPLIDEFMINKLYNIYNNKLLDASEGGKELDWWVVIVGGEGSGKSTMASDIIYEYCKTANLPFVDLIKTNVAFDEFDIFKFIVNMDLTKKYQFIWGDEGANIFFNRESMSKLRKYSVKFANSMRFLRYFVVICSVELKQLDTIIRDHRVKSLIRIQEQGIYHYYNHEQILRLMLNNQRNRDSQFNWRAVEPENVGWFGWNPETKKLVDMLKMNYLVRFQMEAKQEYKKMILGKLKNVGIE